MSSVRDAFIAMRKMNPEVKVLLLSGFGRDHRIREVLDEGALGFIQKPFRPCALSRAVAEVLVQ